MAPDGRDYCLIVEGGAWWRFVQTYIAERDGDTERAKALQAETDKALAELTGETATALARL